MNPFVIQEAEYGKFTLVTYPPSGFHPAVTPFATLTQDGGPCFITNVALGRVPNVLVQNKFGRNPDTDTTTTPEDIWQGGGLYTGFPDASLSAEPVTISSTSTSDCLTGSGMRSIEITGLDESWNVQTETVVMSTASTSTSTLWRRLNLATVKSVGVSANQGTVTIRNTYTTQNVFVTILPGINRSHIAAWTVPANYTALLYQVYAALRGKDGECLMDILMREGCTGPFIPRHPFWIATNTPFTFTYTGGLKIPGKTDIVMRCESTTVSNVDITGGFDIVAFHN